MNICQYFRTSLNDAISLVYPHLHLEQYPIFFQFSKPGYGDICTPVARKIASDENHPFTKTAEKIVSALKWDTFAPDFMEPARSSVLNGFINFRLKQSYLNSKTVSVCAEPVLNENPSKINYHKYSEFVKAHKLLLSSSGIIDEIDTANPEILTRLEEIQLMREISIAEPQEIFSGNNRNYFCWILCRAFEQFYQTCPLYTSSTELTRARFLLTKAFYNRMTFLLKKTIL